MGFFESITKYALTGLSGLSALVSGFDWGLFSNMLARYDFNDLTTLRSRQAASFDGTDDFLSNNTAAFQSSDSSGTISAWVEAGFEGNIFSSSDEATDEQHAIEFSFENNRPKITAVASDTYDSRTIDTDLNASNTNMVSVNSNGTSWTLFADGVAQTDINGFPFWKRTTLNNTHIARAADQQSSGQDSNTFARFGSVSGTGKYIGAVLAPNGFIYCIPWGATSVLRIDPVNNTTATFGSLGAGNKWFGGAVDPVTNTIYCAPYDATTVLKINTDGNSASTFGSFTGSAKWAGIVYSPTEQRMFTIPFTATNTLVIDPSDDSTGTIGSFNTSQKWVGGALSAVNGDIYGAPFSAQAIFKIDTSANTAGTFGSVSSVLQKWYGCVSCPRNGKIYCIPRTAENILIINTVDDSTTTIGNTNGLADKWYGGVYNPNNEFIYGMPFDDILLLRINTQNDTFTEVNVNVTGGDKWIGGACDRRGIIYSAPFTATDIFRLSPNTQAIDPNFVLSPLLNKF